MSEAAAPEGGKKKGKLPIIAVVVLVLAGGGFFMMKGKGDGKEKKKPAIELGEGDKAVIEMEEKLYNLADRQTFLRVTLAFHLKKDFDASHLTKDVVGAVDDAVTMVMMSKRPENFFGVMNQIRLKRELAWAVNRELAHHDKAKEEKEEEEEKDSKKKKKGKEEEEAHDEHAHQPGLPAEIPEPETPGWDSDEGPILKVYFRSLAVQ